MMVKPSVTELLEHAENRYELVIATSKRARQISNKEGQESKIKNKSAVTEAANEIAEGKVRIVKNENDVEKGEEQC